LLRHLRKHPPRGQRRARFIWLLFCVVVVIALSVPGPISGKETWKEALLSGVGWLFIFTALYGLFSFGNVLQGWIAVWSLHHDRRMWGPRSLQLAREGLIASDESGTATTFWHAITSIVQYRRHAFFFTGENEAFTLPQRAFINEQDFEQFLELARWYREDGRRFLRGEGQA
jgi:hypothetical protein